MEIDINKMTQQEIDDLFEKCKEAKKKFKQQLIDEMLEQVADFGGDNQRVRELIEELASKRLRLIIAEEK